MHKRWVIVAVVVLVLLAAGALYLLNRPEQTSSNRAGAPKATISLSDALKDLNSCEVGAMTLGGGVTPNGAAPDEGYAYLSYKNGDKKVVYLNGSTAYYDAQRKCNIMVAIP